MALTVKPFVQKTHEEVVDFLSNKINATFVDFKDQDTIVNTPRFEKIYNLASLFFAGLAYLAYNKGQKYAAIGLGAIALASAVYINGKTVKSTPEFAKFNANCDISAAHLTNAFASKAQFMIDQVNTDNGWLVKHDQQLQTSYENAETTKSLDTSKVTADQAKWRKVHAQLCSVVKELNFGDLTDLKPEVKTALEKVLAAKDLVLTGQSPVVKGATYVNYVSDKVAQVWEKK